VGILPEPCSLAGFEVKVGFGECVYDADTRQVLRSGRPVEVSPKAFELLGALLERRPRALSRAELHDRLWPGTLAGHTTLARQVVEIRKATGDRSRAPRFVRTVHRFGYAFCGEATELRAAGEPGAGRVFPCGLFWGPREIGLAEGDNLVGRAPDCVVRIDASKISRHHARIRVSRSEATIEDLGSKNGTFLRGKRVEEAMRLAQGDEIGIGSVVLIFCGGYGPGSTETA